MTIALDAASSRPRAWAPAITRRLGKNLWALADQVLISGANFVTMLLAFRGMGEARFGEFTLIYTALLFANMMQSALITQPHNVLGATRKGLDYIRYTTSVG